MGIQGPLPVIKGTTDLDIDMLIQMIFLRKSEDAVFKANMQDELRRATANYKGNPNATPYEQREDFYKFISSLETRLSSGKKGT